RLKTTGRGITWTTTKQNFYQPAGLLILLSRPFRWLPKKSSSSLRSLSRSTSWQPLSSFYRLPAAATFSSGISNRCQKSCLLVVPPALRRSQRNHLRLKRFGATRLQIAHCVFRQSMSQSWIWFTTSSVVTLSLRLIHPTLGTNRFICQLI